MLFRNSLPPFGHVPAVQVSGDRFSGLPPRSNGADGHSGAGLHIPSCKNAVAARGTGNGIYFNGTLAGKGEPRGTLKAVKGWFLPDSHNELIDPDVIFAFVNRKRASPA